MAVDARVLEFGGSLGHFFYSIRELLGVGSDVSWEILELPQAAERGRLLAQRKAETRLQFSDSSDSLAGKHCDIFLTAGTLQYVAKDVSTMCQELSNLPTHVLIHTLPAHQTLSYWTLQRLGNTELPYRIYSINDLKDVMAGLGYQCVDQWRQDRSVEIPFHLDRKIHGYMGFYFRLS